MMQKNTHFNLSFRIHRKIGLIDLVRLRYVSTKLSAVEINKGNFYGCLRKLRKKLKKLLEAPVQFELVKNKLVAYIVV